MTRSDGFHAENAALTTAAGRDMPNQVSALDGARRTFTTRQVPNEAFARVAGSPAATTGHQRAIADGDSLLDKLMRRLRDIAGGVSNTNTELRRQDQDTARRVNETTQPATAGGRTSQNGWSANDPALTTRTVPGTNVRLRVADGPAGDVLMHVAEQFNDRVENLHQLAPNGEVATSGYNDRNIRGNSTTLSNHASGTAIDLNSDLHPPDTGDTFTPAQVTEIHSILNEVDGVVRWGGDYHNSIDAMHFEINAGAADVQAVANRLDPR